MTDTEEDSRKSWTAVIHWSRPEFLSLACALGPWQEGYPDYVHVTTGHIKEQEIRFFALDQIDAETILAKVIRIWEADSYTDLHLTVYPEAT